MNRNEPQIMKKERLKQFLARLEKDPSLGRHGRKPPALSELLQASGMPYSNGPLDISKLLAHALKQKGIDAGPEEMVDHVIQGGTIEQFLNRTKERIAT
jgi:hypothetical protein